MDRCLRTISAAAPRMGGAIAFGKFLLCPLSADTLFLELGSRPLATIQSVLLA